MCVDVKVYANVHADADAYVNAECTCADVKADMNLCMSANVSGNGTANADVKVYVRANALVDVNAGMDVCARTETLDLSVRIDTAGFKASHHQRVVMAAEATGRKHVEHELQDPVRSG